MNYLIQIINENNIIETLKILFVSIFTYAVSLKFLDRKIDKWYKKLIILIELIAISIIYVVIKKLSSFLYCTIFLVICLSIILENSIKSKFGYSILVTMISLSINYIILFMAIIVNFVLCKLLNIKSRFIILIMMLIIYSIWIFVFFKIRKFDKGLSFLKYKSKNDYIDIFSLNISVIIIFAIIMFDNYTELKTDKLGFGLIIFSIIMFITIQKSLQLYYKQKLLVKELDETKEELENTRKELKQVEEENLNFSKKSHTLAHRQKSLEHKIEELTAKAEISAEEAGEVKDRLKEIEKDLYKETATVELSKTEIPKIDDMLKYMQSECIKNKIDFELQLTGNIHHMTNNLISKEDLEILLADHIKDAIIAINHSDNINRSILV